MTAQECRKVLLNRKQELNSRRIPREDIAIERNAEDLDEIQQNADRALALDSMTRNWHTTSLISEALKRIEDSSYGLCAGCDGQISAKRLAAIPWAKYCIRCQEAADQPNAA